MFNNVQDLTQNNPIIFLQHKRVQKIKTRRFLSTNFFVFEKAFEVFEVLRRDGFDFSRPTEEILEKFIETYNIKCFNTNDLFMLLNLIKPYTCQTKLKIYLIWWCWGSIFIIFIIATIFIVIVIIRHSGSSMPIRLRRWFFTWRKWKNWQFIWWKRQDNRNRWAYRWWWT